MWRFQHSQWPAQQRPSFIQLSCCNHSTVCNSQPTLQLDTHLTWSSATWYTSVGDFIFGQLQARVCAETFGSCIHDSAPSCWLWTFYAERRNIFNVNSLIENHGFYTVIHNYGNSYEKWNIFLARPHLWLQLGKVKPEIMLCETVLNLSTLNTLTYLLQLVCYVRFLTFSRSLMVSVGVSALGTTSIHFIEPGVNVNGQYYREIYWCKNFCQIFVNCQAFTVSTRQCASP